MRARVTRSRSTVPACVTARWCEQDFKAHFLEAFESKVDTSVIDWDTWFFAPGLVAWEHEWDNTLRNAATTLADKWCVLRRARSLS